MGRITDSRGTSLVPSPDAGGHDGSLAISFDAGENVAMTILELHGNLNDANVCNEQSPLLRDCQLSLGVYQLIDTDSQVHRCGLPNYLMQADVIRHSVSLYRIGHSLVCAYSWRLRSVS